MANPQHAETTINFKLQDGPIREVGVNGRQIDELFAWGLDRLREMQGAVPSRETALAITKGEELMHWLEHRRKGREVRGVEGTGAR
jgi:hypothetical protein